MSTPLQPAVYFLVRSCKIMIEIVLQIPASDIFTALNLIVSGVAALAALLVLWFTNLKGPDIGLVSSHSKIEYQELAKGDLSLTRVAFKPLDLVFANDGSRSGALIDVQTNFKPVKGFEPFFWMQMVSLKFRSDTSLDPSLKLPVVIPDRGTLVVTMEITLLFKSWKDGAKLAEIPGDMADALRTVWKDGQVLLKRFAELNDSIGTLEISVRRTTRRRLRTTIADHVVSKLNVPVLSEWIKTEARKYVDRFSEIYPPDDQAATFIRQTLDPFLNDTVRNGQLLESQSTAQGQQLSTNGWDRWFGTWRDNWDQTYRAVITRNDSLTKKIVDYYQSVMRYNKRVTAAGGGERRVIENMRLELKKASDELNVDLQSYRKTIFEATEHLLPGT